MVRVISPLAVIPSTHYKILRSMEDYVVNQLQQHLLRRRLWLPSELLRPGDGGEVDAEMVRIREAAKGLPDEVRVALAINLLTEEGLPHFHRLIATHLGNESAWNRWNGVWTAEEDRHGCVLRDYVRDARIFDMRALESMQYRYIEVGFNPQWESDPYRLLAYTSLQERATQMAHANAGRASGRHEPLIQRILAHISSDESRHYAFYRNVFGEILARDSEHALYALYKVMPTLAMPGHAIPNYDLMSDVMRRANIYGPRHYQKIVEELLAFWRIGVLTGLSAAGRELQNRLMKIPERLRRMADFLESRSRPRNFAFDFLGGRLLSI